MSSWKLVEAIPEDNSNHVDNSKQTNSKVNPTNTQRSQGRGYRYNNSNNFRGRGRGRNYDQQYQQQQQFVSEADRRYIAFMAVQQIELIFTTDNLCMDTYIRSYMDEAGFVPIALVLGYPNVAGFYAQYYDIVQRLQEISESSLLEVDIANETIRLKEGWEVWLMPNAYGGRGVPRYIKQQLQQDNLEINNTVSNNEVDTNNNSDNNEEEVIQGSSELDNNNKNNI